MTSDIACECLRQCCSKERIITPRINDGLYESSPELEQAKVLYNTVDKTCLKSYIVETKTLVKVLDGKEEILKKGFIKNPRKGLRF